jgi:hypothetical protein
MEGGRMMESGEMLQQRHGTRMTRIGRIFTDIFNPCASVSSVQSVFYRNPAIIDDDKKPQMNADERRYIPVTYFVKTTHRKGRKERKAAQQEPLRSCVKKIRCGINNELGRTDTNSDHSELVRVRFSSLLISILRLFYAQAPGRAPQPACHPRMSRAGGIYYSGGKKYNETV